MSEQNKTYEQARDEAAKNHAFNGNYSNNNDEAGSAFAAFKAGSDFGRSYEQKLNADLLADCKLMIQALRFYSLKSNYSLADEGRNYDVDYKCYELNENTYADEELGTRARVTLAQLKHKENHGEFGILNFPEGLSNERV